LAKYPYSTVAQTAPKTATPNVSQAI